MLSYEFSFLRRTKVRDLEVILVTALANQRELRRPFLIDLPILIVALILVSFSLIMVYSTTGVLAQEKYGDPFLFIKRQSIAAVLGLVLLYICSRIPLEKLRAISPYCFLIAIFLLCLTLVPGIGEASGGARRWISLAGIRFQPSEFAKVLFVIYMAGFLGRHENKLSSFTYGVAKPAVLVGIFALLLLMQPDFGSVVIIGSICLAMVAVTGIRLKYLIISAALFLLAGVSLVITSPYRMQRVLGFLKPWEDASGKGYQLIQSLIAIGTGKVEGVGLGASQQKLFFLPAAHTDFIFSVVGEELGFLGCVLLIILFLTLLWRGSLLAAKFVGDSFTFSMVVGLTLLIVLPALLNVGVATGLLPTKGMVLPLVGYGGSSLLACLIVIGLLLAVSRRYNEERV